MTNIWTQEAHNSTLSASVDIIIGIYLLSLGVIILCSNVVILLTCILVKRAVSDLELCIANTALASATVAAAGLPMATISCFNHGWNLSRAGCVLEGFLVYYLSMVINGTLTLMSILRYIKVCRPSIDRQLTRHRVILLLVGTYLYGGIWAIPPLAGIGRYDLEPFNLVCALDWESVPLLYVVPLFFFGYAVPIGCMMCCYVAMVYNVHKASRRLQRCSNKKDLYLTKIVVMMCSGFIVAWTPYAVVTFMAQFNPVMLETRYLAAPSLFAKTSLAYNPIIYYYMVKRFRDEVRQLVCGFTIRHSAGESVDMNEMVEMEPEMVDRPLITPNKTCTCVVAAKKYTTLARQPSQQTQDVETMLV